MTSEQCYQCYIQFTARSTFSRSSWTDREFGDSKHSSWRTDNTVKFLLYSSRPLVDGQTMRWNQFITLTLVDGQTIRWNRYHRISREQITTRGRTDTSVKSLARPKHKSITIKTLFNVMHWGGKELDRRNWSQGYLMACINSCRSAIEIVCYFIRMGIGAGGKSSQTGSSLSV